MQDERRCNAIDRDNPSDTCGMSTGGPCQSTQQQSGGNYVTDSISTTVEPLNKRHVWDQPIIERLSSLWRLKCTSTIESETFFLFIRSVQ